MDQVAANSRSIPIITEEFNYSKDLSTTVRDQDQVGTIIANIVKPNRIIIITFTVWITATGLGSTRHNGPRPVAFLSLALCSVKASPNCPTPDYSFSTHTRTFSV